MYAGGIKLVGLLGASITALFLSSAATAESVEAPGAQKVERSAARKSAEPQNAASTGEVEKLAEVDSRPKKSRDQAEIAASRVRELDHKTRKLAKDLEGQR